MGSGASARDLEPFRDTGGAGGACAEPGRKRGQELGRGRSGRGARSRPRPTAFSEPGRASGACAELSGRWAAAGPSQKGAWLWGLRAGFAGTRAVGWRRMLVEAGLFLCCVVLFPRPVVF